jgi:hypothetical protein
MKTSHCDECAYLDSQRRYDEVPCDKGHKPKFYKPRGALDTDYGWKRKCADFRDKASNPIRTPDGVQSGD